MCHFDITLFPLTREAMAALAAGHASLNRGAHGAPAMRVKTLQDLLNDELSVYVGAGGASLCKMAKVSMSQN